MILGILSDSHDKVEPTKAALRALRDAGAERIVHCGDVGGTRIIDLLAGENATLVWGNNDWDRPDLARYCSAMGVRCGDTYAELLMDDKHIVVTHGDEPKLVRRALDAPNVDYLLTGHTHIPRDDRVGKVRWINPGALHRAPRKTVAVLDVGRDLLKLIEIAI